ncbi:hypothetical protein DH2020_034731 [Rehmannia glutinosa]|uniref:DUF4283 domain-containing protein n=1 Tax=Rehmannia glutinosa TaxID=99300 RepID=A0ABR0VBD2_REHGL
MDVCLRCWANPMLKRLRSVWQQPDWSGWWQRELSHGKVSLMADFSSCPPEYQTPKLGSYANVTASSSNRSNLPFDPKRIVPVGTHQVRDGKQVLGFSSSENDRLAASWKLTLIGKFSFAIPHPKGIDSGLSALNLKGTYSLSFANPSHIIIKLQLEEDFNKLWMGTLWSLGGCPMRVFKWTPSFNPRIEAPLAPVWVRLPGLPIHFFDHNALFAIGMIIGTPLQVDSLTASRSRLSMARVCVELDLLKERIEEVVLEFDDTSHAQKITYERIPDYCTHCKHIGHSIEGCYMNGKITRPPPPVRRHPTRGAQRAVAQNHEWVMVKKKGPRETVLVPKEFLKLAKNSKHTYFEDNHSYAGTNRFSSLENEVFQPLDTLPQLIKGPDQVNGSHLDDQIDSIIVDKNLVGDVAVAGNENMASVSNPNNLGDNSCLKDNLAGDGSSNGQSGLENGVIIPSTLNGSPKCLNHSIPTLSSFEINKHTSDLHLGVTHAFEESFKATKECQLGPPSLYSQTNCRGVSKGINCGALPEILLPAFSTPATLLEGFNGQFDNIGNLHGPTSIPFHVQKVENGQHILEFDKSKKNGPISFSSSRVAPSNAVGPDAFLSPFNNLAIISKLDPPHHPPSAAHASHAPVEQPPDNLDQDCLFNGMSHGPTPMSSHEKKVEDPLLLLDLDVNFKNGPMIWICAAIPSKLGQDFFPPPTYIAAHDFQQAQEHIAQPRPDYLGQKCYLSEAQIFSSTPAQSSSAADGSESNSTESYSMVPGDVFVDPPNQDLDHSPMSMVYVIKEVGLIDTSGPNKVFDHSGADDNIINSEDGKNDTKWPKNSIGFKAHGKSAPMAKLKPKPESHFADNTSINSPAFNDSSSLPVDELDGIFKSNLNIDKTGESQNFLGGDDIFGGPVSSSNRYGEIDLESVLNSSSKRANDSNSNLRDSVGSNAYDDLLGSESRQNDSVDDLLGSFGVSSSEKQENKGSGFDDLIPGFGGAGSSNEGVQSKTVPSPESNGRSSKPSSTLGDDPFLVFESSVSQSDASWSFTGPSEQDTGKDSIQSSLDELDDFAMGRGQNDSRTDGKGTTMSKPSAGTASNGFENVDELDAFFGAGVQQNHAAPTSSTQDSQFDIFFGEEKGPGGKQTSGSSFNTKETYSATNIVDNFTALFGDVATSSEEFQEIEGEPEERRRARLNRHTRMNARVAEALAEKNQRDLQSQHEQEEKRRLAETLDNDIKCWAAGKEGNLRALLSSLQQVLWPECGWRPVSLTDMITSDSVKKVYKKATLYVHPDKVQQKGATLHQKYIAEKVFDLLKPGTNSAQKNLDEFRRMNSWDLLLIFEQKQVFGDFEIGTCLTTISSVKGLRISPSKDFN